MIVSLNGRVLWISPARPGKDSDIVITQDTGGEWFQILQDEYGFGYAFYIYLFILVNILYRDAGFEGMEMYHISSPPKRDTPLYKIYAHHRIIVENTFARIKDWRCCKETVRGNLKDEEKMLQEHYKRWVIVCGLINKYGL